jgi:hypothetical protein
MCKGIAKNIGFLFSYDFWQLAFKDKDFPVIGMILLVVFTSIADILRMIFIPGYPGKVAE